jgi:carbamoyl-phosphate synthase large subunit
MSLNVLVTAGSRRVPLVRAFQRAIRELGETGSVMVTDVNPLSPAVHVADRSYLVPLADDPRYLDTILRLCQVERINLLVPTIDDELPLFGAAQDRFGAIGCRLAASPFETAVTCNDKFRTCAQLIANGVPAAPSYLPSTLPRDFPLPAFVKPRYGRGGVSAYAATRREELDFFVEYVPDAVIQPYLAGPEYTIDLLCDFEGRPLSIVPRERVVIRAGVIDRGRTVADRSLIDLALDSARVFRFIGAANIQCRVVDGRPIIFEINPRFSGGIPLTIAAGANFPEMLLRLASGRVVEPAIGRFKADLWMTSFETSFFMDEEEARAGAHVASMSAEEVA